MNALNTSQTTARALQKVHDLVISCAQPTTKGSPSFIPISNLDSCHYDAGAFRVYLGTAPTIPDHIAKQHGCFDISGVDIERLADLVLAQFLPFSADYIDLSMPILSQLCRTAEKVTRNGEFGRTRSATDVVEWSRKLTVKFLGEATAKDKVSNRAKELLVSALLPAHLQDADLQRISHQTDLGSALDRQVTDGDWRVFAIYPLIACIKWADLFGSKRMNIVLIDDNYTAHIGRNNDPTSPTLAKELEWLSTLFDLDVWLVGKDRIHGLYNDLVAARTKGEMRLCYAVNNKITGGQESPPFSLECADLILLDLQLNDGQDGSDVKNGYTRAFSGKDMLPLLNNVLPHIPVFVLTKSHDPEDIRDCLAGGADYFLSKELTIRIPDAYIRYLTRLGPLLLHMRRDHGLRRQMIGNLRYWAFKKEYLWFGDKCYHMIGHAYDHCLSVWRYINEILAPILDHFPSLLADDEDLFVLSMAVWLHDIGHKGGPRSGEAFEIRELHGVLSAELLLSAPRLYGIWSAQDEESDQRPYRGTSSGYGKTVMDEIYERIQRVREVLAVQTHDGLDTAKLKHFLRAERIALLCIYHQSNSVLHREDLPSVRSSAVVPDDFYKQRKREYDVYALDDFAEAMSDDMLRYMSVLLRVADGIDIGQVRVGDPNERDAKVAGLGRDLQYQFSRLERLVLAMADQANLQGGSRSLFKELFYDQVVNDILSLHEVSEDTRRSQRDFRVANSPSLNLDTYHMLRGFIEFICVQEGHFDFHSCIDYTEIKRDTCDPRQFCISYHSTEKADWLKQHRVKQKGHSDTSLLDRFIGTDGPVSRKGCIRRELESGRNRGLKYWFDPEQIRVFLIAADQPHIGDLSNPDTGPNSCH